jgi:type IV pilus assembly protein PilB
MARKRLGEILIAAGVLDETKLRAALAEQRRWGGHLGRILVDMRALSEEAMVSALAHQLNFPTVNLDTAQVAGEVLDLVPPELAEQYSVIPFQVQGKFLDVAMADPTNLGIIDELRIRTRLNVRPHLAGPKMIERALSRFYGRGAQPWGGDRHELELGPPGVTLHNSGVVAAPMPERPSASQRRAQGFEQLAGTPPPSAPPPDRDREIASLQSRVQHLEALVARDEDVLRKLMGLLIEKGMATREEILERLQS